MRRIPAFFCCFACHAAHPPAAAPDAPTVVSATSGVRSASLSWNAPSDGGAPITGYVIHQSDGGAFARVQAVARGTQATVASLNYGLTYRFKVQAENSVGAGPLSDASPAVTFPDAFTLAAPALVIARQYHTATLLPTGSVLVVGGAGSSAELYEPGAGAMPTGGLHALRYQHTATLLHDGTILIAGGRSNGTGPLGSPFPTDAETYDAGAFTLTTKGLVTGRTLTDAALLADGRVLVAGGLGDPGNGGGCCTPLASAEVYDPSLRAFSSTGSLIAQRDSHTATALSNGRVLIAGGFDGNALASSELYDPEHGAFIPAGSLRAARFSHAAARLQDGRVLLVGGLGLPFVSGSGGTLLASAELFNPGTGAFTPAGSLNVARSNCTATTLTDGRVLVAGGEDGSQAAYDTAEVYDPATNQFTLVNGHLSAPRVHHTASLLPSGYVALVAGRNSLTGALGSVDLF